jgi:hypothetical protein
MKFLTAQEAKNISDSYLPKEIIHALNYVFLRIAENASHGENKIILYEEDIPKEIRPQIKSVLFDNFMKRYGYKIKKELKEYYSCFDYKITISW